MTPATAGGVCKPGRCDRGCNIMFATCKVNTILNINDSNLLLSAFRGFSCVFCLMVISYLVKCLLALLFFGTGLKGGAGLAAMDSLFSSTDHGGKSHDTPLSRLHRAGDGTRTKVNAMGSQFPVRA